MNEPTYRNQKLNWNLQINTVFEHIDQAIIRFCYVCDLPILVFGRMIPCKHAYCYNCALASESNGCPRCQENVQRIEKYQSPSELFICPYGAARVSSRLVCGRAYLSQRDLDAHFAHRHQCIIGGKSAQTTTTDTSTSVIYSSKVSVSSGGGGGNSSILISNSAQQQQRRNNTFALDDQQKHSSAKRSNNLITIPLKKR